MGESSVELEIQLVEMTPELDVNQYGTVHRRVGSTAGVPVRPVRMGTVVCDSACLARNADEQQGTSG